MLVQILAKSRILSVSLNVAACEMSLLSNVKCRGDLYNKPQNKPSLPCYENLKHDFSKNYFPLTLSHL